MALFFPVFVSKDGPAYNPGWLLFFLRYYPVIIGTRISSHPYESLWTNQYMECHKVYFRGFTKVRGRKASPKESNLSRCEKKEKLSGHPKHVTQLCWIPIRYWKDPPIIGWVPPSFTHQIPSNFSSLVFWDVPWSYCRGIVSFCNNITNRGFPRMGAESLPFRMFMEFSGLVWGILRIRDGYQIQLSGCSKHLLTILHMSTQTLLGWLIGWWFRISKSRSWKIESCPQ